ncbi:putative pteridine transporter [Leishmania mexicana MHOM/GT/2001/U1103]|uniref:Pteridine transporter n=1 Tax=Leishmania mexicana (strain MHOM/GT/2001/U1103) TaxID=929439 RepID=E9AKQ9_LEIMU|nr:putative pteridine transporter [Leishmania mexicana MHOM/GT/2001/U1103]CBZ23510.1 putative pteridine transporter [Leishmania mexicana MHOM/GT/2001/U1103]
MAANYREDREKDNEFNSRLRVNLSAIDDIDNVNQAHDKPGEGVGEDGDYVHPDARALFAKMSCLERVPIFGKSCQGYGPRCTLSLGFVYFLNKGVGFSLINYACFSMFTSRFGVSGVRYQRLASIAKLGFSIKAFAAMMSDSVAIFAYTKRWYCTAACIVGAGLTVGYGSLPEKESSADIAAGFIFLTSFCVANVDILSEGHYSRLMRRRPASGPSLISWIWWFILLANIVGAVIQGPLSDKKIPQVGLFIAAGTQLLSAVFFIWNWYGEGTNREEQMADTLTLKRELKRALREHQLASSLRATESGKEEDGKADSGLEKPVSAEAAACYYAEGDLNSDFALDTVHDGGETAEDEVPALNIVSCCGGIIEINRGVCMRNWRIFVYSLLMACSVITMMCVTVLGTRWQLLYSCIAVVLACGVCAFWALPFLIAKVSIYFFSYAFLYLQLPGALDSFYMASKECYPEGPHFSYVFYNTISAVIGNLAGIVAVAAFPYLFSKHSLRFTLMFTYFIQVLASAFDIIMVKRWNLYIGIPDHAMYLFGDAIVYEVSYYLAWMPTVILLSRICPRGSESMVYALVAGFGNLGASMSNTVGSLLMEFKWPITTKGTCDFSNVPMLLLVGHVLLPMLIVPLSFVLVPAARICDDIDVNGNTINQKAQSLHRKQRREAGEPINKLSP